jgi:hypothetical protein
VCIPGRIIQLKFGPETPSADFLSSLQRLSIAKICGNVDDDAFVTGLNLAFTALDLGDEEEAPRCVFPLFLDTLAADPMIAVHVTPRTSNKLGVLIGCSLTLQSGFELPDAVAWLGLCGMPLTCPLSLSHLKKRTAALKKHNRWAPRRLKKVEPHVIESHLTGPVAKSRRVADQRLDPLYVLNGRGEGLAAFGSPSQSMMVQAPRGKGSSLPAVLPPVGKVNAAQSVNLGKLALAPDMLRQFQAELGKK